MTKRTDINFWIYDIEVFMYDWIVTFKQFWTNEIVTIHNDHKKLMEFFNRENFPVLIGYNNSHYDDYILKALLLGSQKPFELSCHIISEKQSPWEWEFFKEHNLYDINLISFDLMKEISPSITNSISLKQLEGMLGYKIFESNIQFDLDRPLDPKELQEIIDYNLYDVEITAEIFKNFGSGIDAHIALIENYKMLPTSLIWTPIKKAAHILGAQNIMKYYDFEITKDDLPEIITNNPLIEKDLIDFYINKTYSIRDNSKKEYEIILGNQGYPINIKFAFGGLHSSINNLIVENKEIWNIDVASYYPNLMIKYNLVSDSIPNGKQILQDLLKQRLYYKKQKNILNESLKLMLNSIYGAMSFENSKLWDKKKQVLVCVVGQLLLYYLVKMITPYCIILQVNTDGIMIIPINNQQNKCNEIIAQWENETGFSLEKDFGNSIYQKDVNNYIFVKDNNIDFDNIIDADSKIKTKGTDVKNWNNLIYKDNGLKKSNNPSNNYSIIDECIVKYFTKKIQPRQIIENCNDPLKFIKIFKLQGKYNGVFLDNNYLPGKTFRIIAVNKDKLGFKPYKAYKVKDEFGNEIWKKEKIALTSDNSEIINYDIRNKTLKELNIDIDIDFYEKLVWDHINLYKGQK